MSANLHLVMHDVVGMLSVLAIAVMGFFVLLQNYKKTVNITLGLTFLGAIVAIISNIMGVSVLDSQLSRNILMWNMSIIFISVLNFHCVMAIIDREKSRRGIIYFFYAIGLIFAAIFIIYPDTFIGLSQPKMYFPNYYTAGSLHWAFSLIFKILIPFLFIYELGRADFLATNRVHKKRYLYFMVSFLLGWSFGLIPTFLTYDIEFDPIWGMLFPLFFAIPFIYGIFQYELLNIRVIAKKAFIYSGTIIAMGLIIGIFDFANYWLSIEYPGFPTWITPIILAIIIVGVGVLIWLQLREAEILKYEFITTVTHKFRTPLTHIKWATENLKNAVNDKSLIEQLNYIEDANFRLVELTDIMASTSEPNESVYKYLIQQNNLSAFIEQILSNVSIHADARKVLLVKDIHPNVYAMFDQSRLKFVVHTIIENAINYTGQGGVVTIKVIASEYYAAFTVTDTGIGIPKNELSLVSTKLYRGERARVTDTEGMGIGLYISRGVISRHHGRLIIESQGENKGSTFGFTLPIGR